MVPSWNYQTKPIQFVEAQGLAAPNQAFGSQIGSIFVLSLNADPSTMGLPEVPVGTIAARTDNGLIYAWDGNSWSAL